MDDMCFATARDLAAALRRGEISSRVVVEAHLRQIERVNPHVNAVVTLVADRALQEADAADKALAAGEDPPVLHGLPVLHKDTHETAGVRTTQGSPLLADHVPKRDELVIERLRAAGAIGLGKTNIPEFAAGSHTFNPVFGLTRNPYDTSRSAGGSSGGAAAALACGMTPVADGSDMGGSLRNPASFCNVVGLRPSPVADDATFLRRATVDLCGRLPTPAEVKAFLADASSDKRTKLIDRLPEIASTTSSKRLSRRRRACSRDSREKSLLTNRSPADL